MQIRLCFKDYDIKLTIEAIRLFDDDCGQCAWSKTLEYINTYIKSRDQSLCEQLVRLGAVLSFVEASHFLHRIASAANSAVKLDEIQDAMMHSGMVKSEDDDLQPWQLVVLSACLKIQEDIDQNATLKKK